MGAKPKQPKKSSEVDYFRISFPLMTLSGLITGFTKQRESRH